MCATRTRSGRRAGDETPPAPAEEGSGRALRADARRNRDRLLAVAEAVFADQGLAVPIDEVARQAGVGVGTVYRHFPTKEELFEAIVIGRLERLADQADHLVDAEDPGEALFDFVRSVGGEARRKRDLVDALASAGIDFKARAAAASERLKERLALLLARAQAVGAVRQDVAAPDLFSLVAGTCMAAEHAADPEASQSRMMEVVLDGLRPAR